MAARITWTLSRLIMATFQEELNFLKSSSYSVAFRVDPDRVRRNLVHKSVDMRLASVKAMLAHVDDSIARELISSFAFDSAWETNGLTPASRLIAPFVTKDMGELLAHCFPDLAIRNAYCFQLFCQKNQSSALRSKLEESLFDKKTDCKTCHLAVKCLSAYGLDQTPLRNRCLNHRCNIVGKSAKRYLQFDAESAG